MVSMLIPLTPKRSEVHVELTKTLQKDRDLLRKQRSIVLGAVAHDGRGDGGRWDAYVPP
jgi:hypothetical protein